MWDFFWKHIGEEMELIAKTPVISTVAFLVAIFIGLMLAKWRYGKTIEVLKAHFGFLKEKLDNVSSVSPKPIPLPVSQYKAQPDSISRQSEINRLLALLQSIDSELLKMTPADYLSPLMLGSHPMQLLEKRKELIAQLEKLGHIFP